MKDKRTYKVDDDYFKRWSHDMAYILGFWFTDGCISKENSLFTITQNKKENKLMRHILSAMRSNYPLKFYRDFCRFDIRSKNIIEDIVQLGGKERKSLDVKFPFVPKKYIQDFVRGLWDGDGYVGNTKNRKSYHSSFSGGSKSFVESLLALLRDNITELNGAIKIDIRKRGTKSSDGRIRRLDHTCYNIVFGPNDTRRLRDFIYSTPSKLRMERKYVKFCNSGKIKVAQKYLTFKESRQFVSKLGIRTQKEWQKYSKENRPLVIPSNPSRTYKRSGWSDWKDWLSGQLSQEII